MPVPASKIRICGSRARTGCITCKSRRVKCDEGRPACARCVKARRECGGYAAERPSKPVQQRHGTSFIVYTDVPKLLSLHAALDYRERGVLDFFHIRAAFDFSTGVAGGLWNRWVPQYAYHESAIHHGLVAVASAHRYYLVLNTCSEDVLDETIKYTMQHYGKAMHATRKLIDSKTEHAPIIASICCVLFSTIESLCGHKQSSVIHLISGLDVLSNCHKALKSDPKLRARYGDIVFDLTRFLFCAGNLVRAMAGNKLAELSCKLDEIHRESEQTEQFDTLAGACASLSDIHSDVTQLRVQMERLRIRSVRNMPPDPTIPPHSALIQKGRELASRYQSFSKTYNAMIEADPSIASAPSLYIGRTVQLCVQCYVTIAVSGTFTSMSYDGFMPQYRQMLYWTRKAIDTLRANVTRLGRQHEPTSSPVSDTDSVSSEEGLLHPLRTLPPEFIDPHFDPMSEGRVPRPEQAPPTFITTTGFLISLAFIVTKCRDPTIRWEAVEILQTCNRREGVWDSRDMAIVAETAVKREEDAARAYWLQKWNESDGEWDQYWPEVVVHEGHGTGKGVEENEAGERRRRVEVILSRAEHIVQEVRIADLHVMFGPEHGAGLGRD